MAPVTFVCLFIFQLSVGVFGVINNSTDQYLDVRIVRPDEPMEESKAESDKCLVQLYSSLEKLRRRQGSSKVTSLIDLSGYALHQSLRNAPVDMYVTDIKVKAPSLGSWVQVQRCQFSRNAEMTTQLLFNDLLISGIVRLLPGEAPIHSPLSPPQEICSMTVRLRRAGLDLRAAPTISSPKIVDRGRNIQVRTESNFVDPHFLSVHAYGCRLDKWLREDGTSYITSFPQKSNPDIESRKFRQMEEEPTVRILSLGEAPELEDDGLNELYRHRISGQPTNSEKLAAVLKVKNAIAQNANTVFQVHGPFSQQTTEPPRKKPLFTPHNPPKKGAISSITELDDSLRPIRPVPHQPFQTLVSPTSKPHLQNSALFSAPPTGLQDVSSEMEDVFLRGTKVLLAKYLEKQLEIPIKEALMTKIGYTVSYG